jgi:two-component system, cell cycle sensor histidine kinase and response regulator CckA
MLDERKTKGQLIAELHELRQRLIGFKQEQKKLKLRVTELKRGENIMHARLRLLKFAESHSLEEFTQATLDESEALTGSTIGFYHLVEADQRTLSLQTWSTNTLQRMCTAEGKGLHYDVAEAGVWADCVHQRLPVIHNSYDALSYRKGMPPGHAPVVRELVVPIFRANKIVAIIGVGNKPSNYDDWDVEAASLLGDLSWDITERKRAVEALQESEERFRLMAENIQDVFWIATPTMDRVIYVSPTYEQIWGRSCQELYRYPQRLMESIHPEDLDRALAAFVAAREQGTPSDHEYRIIKPDGMVRWIHDRGFPVRDDNGRVSVFTGVATDITERKNIEDQYLQAQKMEAVGTLAGGIAHDFNNILTAILGNIGLAALDSKMVPRVQDRLAQAEAACLRAQALSQQLLTFAKGGAPVKKLFSVAELLTKSTAFTCVGASVKCETTFPENLWWIEADPGQIDQVFQNLTINAIQAMPTGGTIKVWAENLTLGTESELPLSPGMYIKITLRDQGTGIPADHLPRIFDPYFTTKQKGSGLGLASTYAIVQQHHGHIAIESKPGLGTSFHIYLPAVDQQVTSQPEEDKGLPVGTGKILVMDDEEMVREVLGKLLARLGYESEFARDGGEAIEMFVQAQESGQPFVAAILDLTVPGAMGGKETLAGLLEIDPQVKAIVSSGYSDDPIMADFQKYGFRGIIAKPYRISELGKILNQVIMKKA